MPDATDDAHELLVAGLFGEAFVLLQSVLRSSINDNVKADAYQLLGALVQIDPSFGDGDECGLSFYRKAMALVPNHIWGAMGVISTFGPRPPDHQDIHAFVAASAVVSPRIRELDTAAQKCFTDRAKLFLEMTHESPNKALNRSGGTAGIDMETRSPPPG